MTISAASCWRWPAAVLPFLPAVHVTVQSGAGGGAEVVTSGLIDQPTCRPRPRPDVAIDMLAKVGQGGGDGGAGAAVNTAEPTFPTKLLHLTTRPLIVKVACSQFAEPPRHDKVYCVLAVMQQEFTGWSAAYDP